MVPPGLGGAQAATNRARWAGGIDRDCVNLVRYFGVFAPNARVRPRVVPTPPPCPPVPQAASCPGAGRTTPPLSHEKFVEALETWVKAGMPCPR